MTDTNFDLIVVGAGPGGYVAAIRAAQLKMKVAIVEANHLGGICLNWGCIPTKALLKSAEVAHMLDRLDEFGFSADNIKFDIKKIIKRSRDVSKQLSSGIAHLMKKNKIPVFDGFGKIMKAGELEVTLTKDQKKQTLKAKHIILATGARARELPSIKVDGKTILTYKEAMIPETLPKKLLVIGSGAIGVEFANFYNALGVDVTILEKMDRVVPVEDAEISDIARKSFERQGMKIHTGADIESVKSDGKKVDVSYKIKDKTIKDTFDRVISAVGIVANVENIGLENTKVQLDRGFVKTNQWLETDEKGIYAIGDITSPPWLAHKASHEGIICVEKIAGLKAHAMNTSNIPGCTYTHPQIASVGLTEAACKEKGLKINVGRFPFMANGKAIALGETEGMIKTIFDASTGELLGAHMIGAEVTELIQGYCIARTLETTEEELMQTIFPHPTLSEMMHESVLSAYNKALHI